MLDFCSFLFSIYSVPHLVYNPQQPCSTTPTTNNLNTNACANRFFAFLVVLVSIAIARVHFAYKKQPVNTFKHTLRYAGQSLMVNDYFPRIERESPESEFSDRDEDDDDYDEDDDDDDDDYEPLQFAIETSGDEQQQPQQQQQEEQHLQKPTIRIKRSPKSGFADYRPSDCDVIIL